MISPKIDLDKDFFYYDENGKKILLNPDEIIFNDQSENNEDHDDKYFNEKNFAQELLEAIFEFFEFFQ